MKDSAINEIEISPDYAIDQTLFAGGNNYGVFKSTNGGINWQSANQGLPVSPGYDGPSITSLAISPDFVSSRTIFASVQWKGTYRSIDAGANWQQIYSRDASAIGISPSFAQDQTLFLKTYTGWTDLIAMSRDGGQTWEILDTAQLQLSFSITSILVSKKFAEDHMIFCAGDNGVWKGIIEVTGTTTTKFLPTTTVPATTTISSNTTTTAPATLVTLIDFKAISGNRMVIFTWSTESEIDNAGFNLYRSESENGEYKKINDSLIPAEGSYIQGASYKFIDKDVKNRKTYYYKLEDIDLSGKSTMHGPVSAMPRWIYGVGK